ncbi:hypothetical protein RUM43_012743 [Polyplax serrata]|uniref:Uncharacterized protein n=1 Tax=Polyplax serrata TaxID=468196 RepID=A0AAN8RZB8_POLSC
MLAKGRTNIELREQFILADGVSQSMSAFKPKTSTSSRSTSITSGSAGPITKIREKSIKSVPMGSTRGTRSSMSQETPDSLSDNEGGYSKPTPRRSASSYRSSLTPSGSLPGSRNSSRPASRTGSKPPSRHGSNLSLDSTDDSSHGRITKTSITPRTSASGRSRLIVSNGSSYSRPRTPTSGTASTPGSRIKKVTQIEKSAAGHRQPMRKLMTFNTGKGVCSLSVNLNDLKEPTGSLTPVRKPASAMPGVPHYEAEPVKLPKSKSVEDNRFGYTGKPYRKSTGGSATKIPKATSRDESSLSADRTPNDDDPLTQ